MKPGGIILTKMVWTKLKYYPFNIGLLIYHLTFLIVGTAYGKIEIGKPLPSRVIWIYKWIVMPWFILATIDGVYLVFTAQWINAILRLIVIIVVWIISVRESLGQIWRAATICHVRLHIDSPEYEAYAVFVSFTAPKVKIEKWSYALLQDLEGSRFSYLDPTFSVTDAEIEAMNKYAKEVMNKPIARRYDFLQLLGYVVNLVCWIVYPPCWGKEVIGWFNLPGGREVCSSGVTAILRDMGRIKITLLNIFPGYSISMVPPCLFWISKNWKKETK